MDGARGLGLATLVDEQAGRSAVSRVTKKSLHRRRADPLPVPRRHQGGDGVERRVKPGKRGNLRDLPEEHPLEPLLRPVWDAST
jgi:hypothetical protein